MTNYLPAVAPSVYRVFDTEGQLLYIGSSINSLSRLAGFASDHKDVVRSVARVEIEHCDTIDEARHREAEAIYTEQPLLNNRGKKRFGPMSARGDKERRFCKICGGAA